MGSCCIAQGAQPGVLWQPRGVGLGGGWEGGSRGKGYIYIYGGWVIIWQKPTQYCKAIILQLKISKKQKKHDVPFEILASP